MAMSENQKAYYKVVGLLGQERSVEKVKRILVSNGIGVGVADELVDNVYNDIKSHNRKKAIWKIVIDNKPFDCHQQYITGAELRQLKGIVAEYQLFLVIKGPWEDELINDGDRVDLARPGIEHFYSCKPNTNNG